MAFHFAIPVSPLGAPFLPDFTKEDFTMIIKLIGGGWKRADAAVVMTSVCRVTGGRA
jgi:hypothetical protein